MRITPSLPACGALAATLLALCLPAQAQTPAPAQGGKIRDRAYDIASEDADMQKAIERARATLDGFLKLHARPPRGAEDFKIKVAFTAEGRTEHIWVTPFHTTPTGFEGTLAGEPRYIPDLDNGQQVRFTRADVSDWGYVQDGRQKGSHTVCVMFRHMPAADANRYRRDHGFDC